MSYLLVGVSHKSAPFDVLEKTVLDSDRALKVMARAIELPFISEVTVVSTCNRVEVYVDTERFHGSVEHVTDLLVEESGVSRDELVRHLYVQYEEGAVSHLFAVVAGLDSMVPGEAQILGQVRNGLTAGQNHATIGSALNALFQQALRVGKRAHAETGIDSVARSLISAALERVEIPPDADVVVAGAGSMASLSVATLLRKGYSPERLTVVNRTRDRADRLAGQYGVRVADWVDLDRCIAQADLLVSCTGATGVVFPASRLAPAGKLTVIDLAIPRDVDEEAAALTGISLVNLTDLAETSTSHEVAQHLGAVKSIVDQEVDGFLAARSLAHVKPTVVALRSLATDVVAREFDRFAAQYPQAEAAMLDSVRRSLNRVAEKLIHAPTVRVQELVDGPSGLTYADALAELFALDPKSIAAVTGRDSPDGGA